MRTMMIAAAAALTLGMGVAFADGGEGPVANTQFNQLPGVVAAQVQQPRSSALAQITTRQTGTVMLAYVTTTRRESDQQWNQNEGAIG